MICPSCQGAGEHRAEGEGAAYSKVECLTCEGTGEARGDVGRAWIETHPNSPAAQMFEAETRVPCPQCDLCPGCGGLHTVTPRQAHEIRERIKEAKAYRAVAGFGVDEPE